MGIFDSGLPGGWYIADEMREARKEATREKEYLIERLRQENDTLRRKVAEYSEKAAFAEKELQRLKEKLMGDFVGDQVDRLTGGDE